MARDGQGGRALLLAPAHANLVQHVCNRCIDIAKDYAAALDKLSSAGYNTRKSLHKTRRAGTYPSPRSIIGVRNSLNANIHGLLQSFINIHALPAR